MLTFTPSCARHITKDLDRLLEYCGVMTGTVRHDVLLKHAAILFFSAALLSISCQQATLALKSPSFSEKIRARQRSQNARGSLTSKTNNSEENLPHQETQFIGGW